MANEFPDNWITAAEKNAQRVGIQDHEIFDGDEMFRDNGVLYFSGEGPAEYMYFEEIPQHLENRC